MVFFTCNICGESVKKPAVEKHYLTRCRGKNKNVSCMDCLKDFGEDYVGHTKCISEAQKYSGKDFVPRPDKNSNGKKQESYMDIIRSILDSSEYNLTPAVRDAFQRLQSVDNVPRKKAKFENYVGNCMRMPKNQATQVWDILEKELAKMKQARQAELEAAKKVKATDTSASNGADAGDVEAPPKKKSKQENGESAEPATVNEFDWNVQLAKIVTKHADGIFVEKLKRKLMKKYTKHLTLDALSEEQVNKFDKKFAKKLKKCDTLHLSGDLVKQC